MFTDEIVIPKRKRTVLLRYSGESSSPPKKKLERSGMGVTWKKSGKLTGSSGTCAMLSSCSNTRKHVNSSDYLEGSTSTAHPLTIGEVEAEENDGKLVKDLGKNRATISIVNVDDTRKKSKIVLQKTLAAEILNYFRVKVARRKVLEEEHVLESHLITYLYDKSRAEHDLEKLNKSFIGKLRNHVSEMDVWWERIQASLKEARSNSELLVRIGCMTASPTSDERSSDEQISSSYPIIPVKSTTSANIFTPGMELGFGASRNSIAQDEISSEERSPIGDKNKISPKRSSLGEKGGCLKHSPATAGVSASETSSGERIFFPLCSDDVQVNPTSKQVICLDEAADQTNPSDMKNATRKEPSIETQNQMRSDDVKVIPTANQVFCLDEAADQTKPSADICYASRKKTSIEKQNQMCSDDVKVVLDKAANPIIPTADMKNASREETSIEKQNQNPGEKLSWRGTKTEPITVDSDDEQTENSMVPNLPERTNFGLSSSTPSKDLHNGLLKVPDTCHEQLSLDCDDEHTNLAWSPFYEDAVSANVMPCSNIPPDGTFVTRSEKVLNNSPVELIHPVPSGKTLKEPSPGISSGLSQSQQHYENRSKTIDGDLSKQVSEDTHLNVPSPLQIGSSLASANLEIHVDKGPTAPLEQGNATDLECSQVILPASALYPTLNYPGVGVRGVSNNNHFNEHTQDPSLDCQIHIQPTSQAIIWSNAGSSIDRTGPGSGPSLVDSHCCSSLGTNDCTHALPNCALVDTDSNQQLEEPAVQGPSLDSQTHVQPTSQCVVSSNARLGIDSAWAGSGPHLADMHLGSSLRSSNSTHAQLDPFLVDIEKILKEDVEAEKNYQHQVMQIDSAKDKALAELNQRYNMLRKNVELSLTQRRSERSTYCEKALANKLLADALMQANDMVLSETEVAKGNYHFITLQMVELQSLLLTPATSVPMPATSTVSPTVPVSNQLPGFASAPYFQPAQIPLWHRYENSHSQPVDHTSMQCLRHTPPSIISSTSNCSTSSPSPGMLLRQQAAYSMPCGSMPTRIFNQH